MYCWLNPESSANFSWVRPLFSLIRLTFLPTSARMSMRGGQPITYSEFINYSMYAASGRWSTGPFANVLGTNDWSWYERNLPNLPVEGGDVVEGGSSSLRVCRAWE